MKYFKFLMLFITMGMLQGCPEGDNDILIDSLTFKNEYNTPVYYICHKVSSNEIRPSDIEFSFAFLVNQYQKQIYSYYESNFKGDYNKKIWILIYKQSTIDSHSWEEIQEQNLYDKRYSFTLDELNAMNWELVYDGN